MLYQVGSVHRTWSLVTHSWKRSHIKVMRFCPHLIWSTSVVQGDPVALGSLINSCNHNLTWLNWSICLSQPFCASLKYHCCYLLTKQSQKVRIAIPQQQVHLSRCHVQMSHPPIPFPLSCYNPLCSPLAADLKVSHLTEDFISPSYILLFNVSQV